MRYPAILGLLAALSVTACQDRTDDQQNAVNPNRSRILAAVPVMPGFNVLDTSGTAEAERIIYRSAQLFDSVSAFYRRRMPAEGWRVVNDLSDSTIMNLYLRKDSATVWIRAYPRPSGVTEIEMISTTVRDTTKQN